MHAYADATKGSRAVKPSAAKSPAHGTAALMDRRPAGRAQCVLSAAMHEQPRLLQLQKYPHMANGAARKSRPLQRMSGNHVGLPDKLKTRIENLSGFSLDDVEVHYNAQKPEQLQAHAYAQGSDIHLAAGQEKHLPHEAWHAVQQKQGRVGPTLQMKGGVPVNDDLALELEAEVMGRKALWLDEFKSVADSLYPLLDAAEILHKPAPIDRQEQQMRFSGAKGDEQFDCIAHEQLPHLHDIPRRLSDLSRDERHKAIGVIRGTDDDDFMQTAGDTAHQHGQYVKGAILAPFIRENRKALLGLVQMMGDATAVFSLERGGSLLADHLQALGRDIMNVKIATMTPRDLIMRMLGGAYDATLAETLDKR